MTITKTDAVDIFKKVITVFPTNIMMEAYDTYQELFDDLGQYVAPPLSQHPAAFYSAGVLYISLDEMQDINEGIVTIAHEIGHQVFDPGSIFASYTLFRLWVFDYMKRHPAENERNVRRMCVAQNIYSDIALNRTIWKNPRTRSILGEDVLKKGFLQIYRCDSVLKAINQDGPDEIFKSDFLAGSMALGYAQIYFPSQFTAIMANMKNPNLKKSSELINLLVEEENLAIKNLQKYYDVCVEIIDNLYALHKDGFRNVGYDIDRCK